MAIGRALAGSLSFGIFPPNNKHQSKTLESVPIPASCHFLNPCQLAAGHASLNLAQALITDFQALLSSNALGRLLGLVLSCRGGGCVPVRQVALPGPTAAAAN